MDLLGEAQYNIFSSPLSVIFRARKRTSNFNLRRLFLIEVFSVVLPFRKATGMRV